MRGTAVGVCVEAVILSALYVFICNYLYFVNSDHLVLVILDLIVAAVPKELSSETLLFFSSFSKLRLSLHYFILTSEPGLIYITFLNTYNCLMIGQ